MPSTPEAIAASPGSTAYSSRPAKAANAGGVATSGLEMSQNCHASELDLRGS